MSDTTASDLARLEQALKIARLAADAQRKQQAYRVPPWALAFAGMTAGAALFAAGIAFSRFFLHGFGAP